MPRWVFWLKVMVMVVTTSATVVDVVEEVNYEQEASTEFHRGINLLNTILSDDPSLLCLYVVCQEPVLPSDCPEGSLYMLGAAQFGCCGACVDFMQENDNDRKCTGNLDPIYGGPGHEKINKTGALATNFLASLHEVSDNVIQSTWCDYGLMCFKGTCYKDPELKNCKTMLNKYISDLADPELYKPYRDDYRWKPVCTREGKFAPKQCIGPAERVRCVCVDPEGNRLFGLAFPEQEELFNSMNCLCSRRAWERSQAGQSPVSLHCRENGNYEALQCEDGWCTCMDETTERPYGPRLPEAAMHMLPCYNKTYVGEQYLRRCNSKLYAHTKLVEAMSETGVRGPRNPTPCDQDGSFQGFQCVLDSCQCYDKYMAEATFADKTGDDCQCARDKIYYSQINSLIDISCKYTSGSYAEEQIQSDYKFCVDEDGVRSGPLVVNSAEYILNCDNSRLCQEDGASPEVINPPCAKACVTSLNEECPVEAFANYWPDS